MDGFSRINTGEIIEDKYGVVYSADGGILLKAKIEKFNCRKYTIPVQTDIIWEGAFEGIDSLEEIVFEDVDGRSSFQYVGEFAFCNCKNLKKIHLPNSIRIMGQCIFRGCSHLEEIHFPERMDRIPCECFQGCSSLKTINIPKGLKCFEICSFSGCKSLEHIQWPKTLEWIEDTAFYGNGFKEVILPEGLLFIGEDAFRDCRHLERLVIPSTVKDIIPWTVSSNKYFQGIDCHSPFFRIEQDALIRNEDNTMLCCWSKRKEYTVPKSVRNLAGFSSYYVEKLIAHEPINNLGYDCFCGCKKLKSFEFKAIENIHPSAFYGLKGITVTVDGKEIEIPNDDSTIQILPYYNYEG